MAESIYFYKLVSPYSEDVTLNCKLTMSQMDDNFLTFKNNDIKSGSYDKESMEISLVRNDGEIIKIDLSSLGDDINERIESAVSGITPGSGSTYVDIELSGELSDDGTLTLTLHSASGDTNTTISGFVTESSIRHDETISGNAGETNPLRINSLERTGKYKTVLSIVDELPTEGLTVGDRYITRHAVNSFGRLYSRHGIELVKNFLKIEESLWRIPTKHDWDTLLDYADECGDGLRDGDSVGEFVGNIAGKVLKSVDYWEGNENLDTFGFAVVPAGYVKDSSLEGSETDGRFWTDTDVDSEHKYIKGFDSMHDNVLQDESKDNEWYSLRLVRTTGKTYADNTASILGSNYNVINFPELNQAWISTNLRYNPGNEYSEQYTYDYEGIVTYRYAMNHWNGRYWEKRELSDGDEVNIKNGNSVTTYVCVIDRLGNQRLIKGLTYQATENENRLVIDAGWY